MITIPLSRYKTFKHTDPNLRWGQELHQFLRLDKVNDPESRVWADKLYEANEAKGKEMVAAVLDTEN